MSRPQVCAVLPWRRLTGGLFILAGILYVLFGWPEGRTSMRYEVSAEVTAPPQWAKDLNPRYSAIGVREFNIHRDTEQTLRISAVQYRDAEGTARSALFVPPSGASPENSLRLDLWRETGAAIRQNAQPDALFLTWWDNAQRARFLAGVNTWVDAPEEAAFPDQDARHFWRKAAGGFMSGERNSRLAKWLAMNAESALKEMKKNLPEGRPVYLLVSLDDLARLSEIETLAGTTLPFEVRVFPPSGNIHTQIAAVRRWASDNGTGSYLVHQLPTGDVRAWRITSEAGTQTLLARLLPFTSSLMKPLESLKLIYQSRWGAYLSLYQWRP
jgi:hydroxylamine oxidation protein HaoB